MEKSKSLIADDVMTRATVFNNTVRTIDLFAGEAVQTLVDIMRVGKNGDRLRAASKILEYSLGKPTDITAVKDAAVEASTMTDAEYADVTGDKTEEELQEIIERKYRKNGK